MAVEFEFLGGIEEWMEGRVLRLAFFFAEGEGEGAPVVRCEGSGIRWKDGMEVTLREVESKRGGIQLKKCPRY